MVAKKRSADFVVILVDPKNSGNIGAVARAMMNFDCERLVLVNPCELDDVCYARAMHADSILDHAEICSSFGEAVHGLDFLVATSSIESQNEKRHLRNAVLLDDFSEKIFEVQGTVGLIFGREDDGLYNDEIKQCDMLVKIPTSDAYLSLNLSHSVCVVLYALYTGRLGMHGKKREIGPVEKEKLYEFFSLLLDSVDYPSHKKENTKVMFQRLMGRAMPSTWEYHTLMGVFASAIEELSRLKKKSG
ncbi:MAG: RNA methyltransferase [Methanobacteriota archaeon]